MMMDFLLAGAIILGAVYMIYRSIWKKRGYCPGCEAHPCPSKSENSSAAPKFSRPGNHN